MNKMILFLALATAHSPAKAAQTIVSLTFDDGSADHVLANQMLNQRGFKGTFYVNSGQIGTSSFYMTRANLDALKASGHEIAGHTLSHLHLTTLSTSQAQREICDDRAQLQNWGFNPVSFAYPFGEYNSSIKSITQNCGYSSARGVGGVSCPGCVKAETIPPPDSLALRTPESIKDNNTIADIQKLVTDAEQSGGGWVTLVFHRICNGCSVYSTTEATLASFFDWLKNRSGQGTVVQTVAQVMGAATPPLPSPAIASLSPSSATAGAPAFTLTVTGSNFASNSAVLWNGASRATTFVSAAQLRAAIPSSDIAAPGTAGVSVLNPGVGNSNSATFTISAGSAPPSGPPPSGAILAESFSYPNGLITNEYAHFNPGGSGAVFSSTWDVLAGSLFADNGAGWTGLPDSGDPNAASSNATGSAVFRAVTKRADLGDVSLFLSLTHQGFVSTSGTPAQAWDGVRLVLRRQAANAYYSLSVNRRDNTAVIKKQLPSGLTTLASAAFPVPIGLLQRWQADVQTQANGAVALKLSVNGAQLLSFLDAGTGGAPIIGAGAAGVLGDNSNFRFDDFIVMPFDVAPAPTLSSITPSSATAGSPGFTLAAIGAGFVSGSTVRWNGQDRPTVFVSGSRLNAQISAGDIASPATAAVTVFSPGAGATAPLSFVISAGSSPAAAPALFGDNFNRPNALITNEYAFFNPNGAGAVKSATWTVTAGSLFVDNNTAWTGVPDSGDPNAASSNATGSAVFRAQTKRGDFGDVAVSFTLINQGFVTTSATPAQPWDGVHLALRYLSENSFYDVTITRRDNTVQVKKKSGSAWTTLASAAFSAALNAAQAVQASARNNADGSVTLALSINGSPLLSITDSGVGGAPLRAAGAIGMRGDNVNFRFDDLSAQPIGSFAPANIIAAEPAAAPAATSLDSIRAFPNPWRADRHGGLPLTIDGLTTQSEVRIFTVAGQWVRTISAAGGAGRWDLNNDSGQRVASGIYLYLVTDSEGHRRRGVIAVIR